LVSVHHPEAFLRAVFVLDAAGHRPPAFVEWQAEHPHASAQHLLTVVPAELIASSTKRSPRRSDCRPPIWQRASERC
jgi:hypothetical protein